LTEWLLFDAGYRTKSGNNWWASNAGECHLDDIQEIWDAYLQYKVWEQKRRVELQKIDK